MDGPDDTRHALRLAMVFLVGACLGSFVNWAIYTLAWHPRAISPWSRAAARCAAAELADRVPVFGWFATATRSASARPRFWVRPLLLELGLGAALAALYWWEVERLGLIHGQLDSLFRTRAATIAPPLWPLHLAIRQPRDAVVLDAGRKLHRHR